jgi:cytoskeletal protein RodZ
MDIINAIDMLKQVQSTYWINTLEKFTYDDIDIPKNITDTSNDNSDKNKKESSEQKNKSETNSNTWILYIVIGFIGLLAFIGIFYLIYISFSSQENVDNNSQYQSNDISNESTGTLNESPFDKGTIIQTIDEEYMPAEKNIRQKECNNILEK